VTQGILELMSKNKRFEVDDVNVTWDFIKAHGQSQTQSGKK
jgi:hypothetical protein